MKREKEKKKKKNVPEWITWLCNTITHDNNQLKWKVQDVEDVSIVSLQFARFCGTTN